MSQPPPLRPPPCRGRREIRECPLPVSSFRANARNLFRSRSGEAEREAGNGKHRASCDWGSRCFMQTDLRRKTANGKRKRSLDCARDDETGKRFPPIPFQSTAEANLRPFGRLLPEEGGRMSLFLYRHFLRKSRLAFCASSCFFAISSQGAAPLL